MKPEDILCKIAGILENLELPYVVTGGYAVSVWGRPRFTADIDIAIELLPQKIPFLAESLLRIDKDVYVDEQAIRQALARQGEFNFIHPQTGLKVDFWISKDEFERRKIDRGIPKKVKNQNVNFISPEDLILSKLLWFRQSGSSRHIEDIESVLKVSKIDLNYIKKWAEKHSTKQLLEKIIKQSK